MDLFNIRRCPTSEGIRSTLTYWYKGKRYRPVLGYNLTPEQERESAFQIVAAIHTNTSPSQSSIQAQPAHLMETVSMTFGEFIPAYLQYLKAKRPNHDGRNEAILTRHLLPHFGGMRLDSIRMEDGVDYLRKRFRRVFERTRRLKFTKNDWCRKLTDGGCLHRPGRPESRGCQRLFRSMV